MQDLNWLSAAKLSRGFARKKFSPVDVAKACLAQIARFKRPKRYLIVDALPKNNYGKVLKTQLRQLLTQV